MDAGIVDALWAQIEPDVFISREQFIRGLADWEIETVQIAGRLAFAVLVKGPEFHFTSFDTGARISLRMIHARLSPIIERHGYALTKTPKDGADRQHRFNKLLGFRHAGEDEFFVTYRLDNKCR